MGSMTTTERAQGLTNVLTFNDDMLAVALTDVSDDLARRRLREGGPSIAWIVGHMLHQRFKTTQRNSMAIAATLYER
jgi:hypothetical protein